MSQPHELLPWQRADWQRLVPAFEAGRLAHALLLIGAPGIGKRHLAGVLARALLCESPGHEARPCGACRSCIQASAGSHPDWAGLAPQEPGGPIKIAAVRDFVHALCLTSQYGSGRVGLIDPADRMTPAAANSLLKALEEPPAGSHILLVTDRPNAVLPTIRSRCQTLRLNAVGAAEADRWLADAPDGTAALMPLARGAPLRAARLAEAGVADAQADWFQALAGLVRGKRDPVAVAETWLNDETDALLDWLYLVCADVLKHATGAQSEALCFARHGDVIADIAAAVDTGGLRRLVPEIVRARRLGETPADARLSLESLCIALFDCRLPAKRRDDVSSARTNA